MNRSTSSHRALKAWTAIPGHIRRSIAGLSNRDLDLHGGSDGLSIRESVHHLVEANLIASNIVLAALGKSGCRYDWSWVTPGGPWMKRLGYDRAPIEPGLELLDVLCARIAAMLRTVPGGMRRHVNLLDAPGAKLRRRTVTQVLQDEFEHAQHHLRDVAATRKAHRRLRTRTRPRTRKRRPARA